MTSQTQTAPADGGPKDWGPFGRPLFDDPSARALSRVGVVDIGSNSVRLVVFDGAAHRPLMTLPDMAARTVRIQSAGKIFSLTGWKVGFVSGAADLVNLISKAHQNLVFTTLNRGRKRTSHP